MKDSSDWVIEGCFAPFHNDGRTGSLATREQRDKFSELLETVLVGEDVDLGELIARQASVRPLYAGYFGERIRTQIRFDNDASEDRTLIELETEDRLGLLYTISRTFAELQLDISAARIVTERGAALDTFYVREIAGGKIQLPGRQAKVELALRAAIGRLEVPV